MMSDNTRQKDSPKHILTRHSNPIRDNIEGILGALLIALIIRHFVFEMFVIPTGSMAPTLLGQHRDLTCPNCGHEFELDSGSNANGRPRVLTAFCRNCGFEIPERTVRNTFCKCPPSWPRQIFWRGGNRVIVNKFAANYRTPERWDVMVFRYPFVQMHCKACGHDEELLESAADEPYQCPVCGSQRIKKLRKNYIKRLIGLPGETLELRHGDVYINGVIARKPPEVQEQLWQFVYDSKYMIKERQYNQLAPRWEATQGSMEEKETIFRLTPDEENRAMMRYMNPMLDFNAYNGDRAVVSEGMGDLRLTVKASLPEGGALELHIREDDDVYTGVVSFGDGNLKTAIRRSQTETLAESELRLDTSVEHVIAFANADDLLELRVDGNTILTHALEIPLSDVPKDTEHGGVAISTYNGYAELSRIKLERDIFYISDTPSFMYAPKTELPSDGFYALGDNSTNSKDSRYWGFVPEENILGTADVVCWPLSHLRTLRNEALALPE